LEFEISNKVLIVSSPKIRGWAWSLEYAKFMSAKGWQVDYIDTTTKQKNKKIINKFIVEKKIFEKFELDALRIVNRSESNYRLYVFFRSIIVFATFFCSKNSANHLINTNIPLERLIYSNMSRWYGTFYLNKKLISKKNTFLIINDLINSIICLERFFRAHGKPDLICTPNGRDATGAAAYSFAKLMNIKFTTIELGFQEYSWEEYRVSPHYPKTWWTKLLDCVKSSATKIEIEKFWKSRLKGNDYFVQRNWRSFYKNNYLPIPKNKKHRVVSFFTSSSHEIPAWENFLRCSPGFNDQFDAVEGILKVCIKHKAWLVIRRHPNSIGTNGVDSEAHLWDRIAKNPNVTYFGPNSQVDSHSLIGRSSVVLCHDSSIGVEALKMRIPSFATGAPFWAFRPENRIKNIKQLESAIKNPILLDNGITDSWATLHLKISNKIKLFKHVDAAIAVFEEIPVFYKN
jgi:hypothetical protein